MNQNKTLVIAMLLLANAATSDAAIVRGRLMRGKANASGIAVTVRNPQGFRTSPAYSRADGMYYIPNVKAGSYTLEVWPIPNRNPLTFPIQVKEPESNIAPVFVP